MSLLYRKIKSCRISKDTKLFRLINFGEIALTGVFPKEKFAKIHKTPLSVVFQKNQNYYSLSTTIILTYSSDQIMDIGQA